MLFNKYCFLSLIFIVAGIIFLLFGFLEGDVEGGFFVVFPFIIGSGLYAFLGIICFFIAFLCFSYSFSSYIKNDFSNMGDKSKKTTVKGGGVVFIGPVPIVFGSSWKTALLMMILGFIIMILLYFLFYK